MPEFLQPLFGSDPRASQYFYGLLAVIVLLVCLALWLLWGSGPRLRRTHNQARRLLQQGNWEEALKLAQAMQQRRSAAWGGRVRNLEGECYRAAGQAALDARDYEAALDHALCAAELLNANVEQARHTVIDAMLAEARRLFAATSGPDTKAVHRHLDRLLAIQPDCVEATFWQGLCRLREGNTEQALESLRTARGGDGSEHTAPAFLDPSLYLGALLQRAGQSKEALRYLTEANRLDKNCPLVTWQLGTAMLAAGGDAQIAVRALQRALGPQGLLLWAANPQRLWVEGFPEDRSFVRRLAAQHAYTCPLWGRDLRVILSQGQTTLAEGLYRLGKVQEAADLFGQVAQQSAPSRVVLRGLGLALARLGRFDEAFTHLRTAHDLEGPKDRWTSGYLALCAARARPLRSEDKAKNVTWALRLATRFTAPGDAEWANLINQLFAEARRAAVPLSQEDQLYLCEHLLSVQATDADAAEAYHHLAATFPDALRPEYAWLYCRAAQQHGHSGAHSLDLFARTFRDAAAARAFFQAHQWDFEEMEFAYLQNAAQRQPGAFPAALGPDFPAHGEQMLRDRCARLAQENRLDEARAVAQVWLMLAPRSGLAHDRLAHLSYQAGDLERAVDLLAGWERLDPANPWPVLRQAVIGYQLGDASRGGAAIRKALGLTQDCERAEVAFLGARLALKNPAPDGREKALELLTDCLRHNPQHGEAQWCLAAVRLLAHDRANLASQATNMLQRERNEPCYHLLAAISHLAAGDYGAAMEMGQRAAADPDLATECAYVMGWAALLRKDAGTAALTLRRVAESKDSPSAAHAQALLGGICFYQGDYEEAIRWWTALDPEQRAAWNLAEPLQQIVLLSALKAMEAGQYEQAAEKIREAGKLGLRDRRLGSLLTLVLVKAGQKLLYQ